MVSIYGLNKRIGNISYYDSQGRDMFTKPYSDETAKVIDEEVSKMIENEYNRAVQILTENKSKLIQLANKLLTAEVIFKEDLEEIFGKRKWDPIVLEDKEQKKEEDTGLDLKKSKKVRESKEKGVIDSVETKVSRKSVKKTIKK